MSIDMIVTKWIVILGIALLVAFSGWSLVSAWSNAGPWRGPHHDDAEFLIYKR